MNRTIVLLTMLSQLLLSSSCATTSSFYGEHRLKASEVREVLVVVDDRADNSMFKGNEFFQSGIVDAVCKALQAKGVNAISGIGKDPDKESYSHLLVLQALGVNVSQGYHESAPRTTYSYQTAIDSQGNACTYSVPTTTGGGGNTYTVREANAIALLFERSPDKGFKKLCESFSYGDGMNLIEKGFNMTATAQVIGYQKKLDDMYRKVFVAAALEMFTKE